MSARPARGQADADAALDALVAVARRLDAITRIEPPAGIAVLQSIVDATVVVFSAEAASLALFEPATGRLVFRVAAGSHGAGVVGVEVAPGDGVAGYVFSTGQPLAIADVRADPRFGHETAARTGYVPRSLLAVPLVGGDGPIGVLEILDRADGGSFTLGDIERASVFARQATVAIAATSIERDGARLLAAAIRAILGADTTPGARSRPDPAAIDVLIATVMDRSLDRDAAGWRLADAVARATDAPASDVDLVVELLDVLAGRARRPRRS